MECNHKLKHNKEEDFIFCQECGKRWGEYQVVKEYIREVQPWSYPCKPYVTWSGDNTIELNA